MGYNPKFCFQTFGDLRFQNTSLCFVGFYVLQVVCDMVCLVFLVCCFKMMLLFREY
jgi:hypothetical protein